MLILIEKNNREQYEDFYSWIEYVYDIQSTASEIVSEWYSYMMKKFSEENIIVRSNQPPIDSNAIFVLNLFELHDSYYTENSSSCFDEYFIRELKPEYAEVDKKFYKIIDNNIFEQWLEEKYKVKPIPFQKICN